MKFSLVALTLATLALAHPSPVHDGDKLVARDEELVIINDPESIHPCGPMPLSQIGYIPCWTFCIAKFGKLCEAECVNGLCQLVENK